MNNIKYLSLILLSAFFLFSCGDDNDEIDKEKPTIDLSIQGAFPVNCDTIYFGEAFEFRALFADNVELGSYSIDIHNNFDHHSHTTEVNECNLGPVKTPVNPLIHIQDYDIPQGVATYETDLPFFIPTGDDNGLFDEGDYHFFISLTDKEGWSAQKGLSIKILHR